MATRKTAKAESQEDKQETATEQKDASAIEAEAASETEQAAAPDAINARVLSKFRDKVSGSYLEPGICLHMSRKRFDEINSVAPLLEEI